MISDVYRPRVNGVSTSIATTRNSLHRLGHRTRLVAPAYPRHRDSTPDITRISARKVPFDPEDYLMKRHSLSRLTETLSAESYDIIHVHTPFMAHHFAVKFSKHRNIPVVETYHTHFEAYLHHYIPFLPKTAGRRIARSMARRLAKGVDGFITPSHAISCSLQHYGIDGPIQVVPTGLDLDEFLSGNRQAFCRRFGIDPSRPSLV